jgi:hypothetical protein
MVAPLVGLAIGAAARAAIKKAATKKLVKEAAKKKPLTNPKSNVKVKPAAKNKPNPPSTAKLMMKEMKSGEGTSRKASIQIKNLPKRATPVAEPANAFNVALRKPAPTIKINSAPRKTAAKPGTKRK